MTAEDVKGYEDALKKLTTETNKLMVDLEKSKAVYAVHEAEVDKITTDLKSRGITNVAELDSKIAELKTSIETNMAEWKSKVDEGRGLLETVNGELNKVEFK